MLRIQKREEDNLYKLFFVLVRSSKMHHGY